MNEDYLRRTGIIDEICQHSERLEAPNDEIRQFESCGVIKLLRISLVLTYAARRGVDQYFDKSGVYAVNSTWA